MIFLLITPKAITNNIQNIFTTANLSPFLAEGSSPVSTILQERALLLVYVAIWEL